MSADAERVPQPYELTGWEARVSLQLACWIGVSLCTLPLFCDALQLDFPLRFRELDRWLALRSTRELSGCMTGALLLSQFAFGIRKRLRLRNRSAFHRWRSAHELMPIAMLACLLLHTRGHSGANANRWLIAVLLGQIAMVQAGHVVKAAAARYAKRQRPPFVDLDRLTNSHDGLIHRVGVRLHVILAISVLVLFSCHVLAVWYF